MEKLHAIQLSWKKNKLRHIFKYGTDSRPEVGSNIVASITGHKSNLAINELYGRNLHNQVSLHSMETQRQIICAYQTFLFPWMWRCFLQEILKKGQFQETHLIFNSIQPSPCFLHILNQKNSCSFEYEFSSSKMKITILNLKRVKWETTGACIYCHGWQTTSRTKKLTKIQWRVANRERMP